MSMPRKPWERGLNVNAYNMNNTPGTSYNSFSGSYCPQDQILNAQGMSLPDGIAGGPRNSSAPPLPPRPNQQQPLTTSQYGGYSNLYSPYSSGMYSSYSSPYNSYGYGGFGNYGYGRFGYGGADMYSRNGSGFVQVAEESSRQAFQSIESIVHAVGSVSMMLESTFHALYSSFRAVLGVADHFSRLKTQFTQIFSTLTLLCSLRWLYRKALYLLGIRKMDLTSEAWKASLEKGAPLEFLKESDLKQNKSNWPIVLFFAVVIGTPWFIWKLLAQVACLHQKEQKEWASGKADHFIGKVEFDFKAESNDEISVHAGDEIRLAPKELQPKVRGWLLGSVDGENVGLVPANYLKIIGKKKGSASEPLNCSSDQRIDDTCTKNETQALEL